MDTLTITRRESHGVTVVELDGKITIGGTNSELRKTLRGISEEGVKQVVLNMGGVSTIDSSGLGEIVAGFATMRRNGGSMCLANISQRISSLMTITKLYTVFDIFESEEKAVESFQSEALASPEAKSAAV
jgi:anti-sigma B factor antagonist